MPINLRYHLTPAEQQIYLQQKDAMFWDTLRQSTMVNPQSWFLLEDQSLKSVLTIWEEYTQRNHIFNEEIEVIQITPTFFALRIKYLGAKVADKNKTRTNDSRPLRKDREMPDWRQVLDSIVVYAKSRISIYTSIRDMRIRHEISDLRFNVTPISDQKPRDGKHPFLCKRVQYGEDTQKKYQQAYQKMKRLQRAGKAVHPDILFAAQPCSRQEREELRPYYEALRKAWSQGTLQGDFLREFLTFPIDEARTQREYFTTDPTYAKQWKREHGFVPAITLPNAATENAPDSHTASPISENEAIVSIGLELLKTRLSAGVGDLAQFRDEALATINSWPPHGNTMLALQVNEFFKSIDAQIEA